MTESYCLTKLIGATSIKFKILGNYMIGLKILGDIFLYSHDIFKLCGFLQ